MFLDIINLYCFIVQAPVKEHHIKNVNNCFNTTINSYLQTSDGQSSIYI
jgi:hypothetical protein